MMQNLKGYLFIIGATIFWGISATVAKFLFTHHFDTLVIVQMRMMLSFFVLFAYFLLFRRDALRVRPADLFRFALLGIVGIAGSNFTYYYAIQATNVATAILLQYMAPLLVLAYAAVTREEAFTIPKISAAAISLLGCFLAVGGIGGSVLALNRMGVLAGVAAAFCWGFTNIILRKLLNSYQVWTIAIYSFMFATLFWLLFIPPWKIFEAGYSSSDWGTFFTFAMVSVLIPQLLYSTGAQYLTASRAIITATFEPIVAIVSAYLILGEILTPIQILGAVLVIVAIVILQYKEEPRVAAGMKEQLIINS